MPDQLAIDRGPSTSLAAEVKGFARSLGFDLVGIARADAPEHADYFRQWLAAGRHGEMAYLANRAEERADPGKYLPGARSVICVALNYYAPLEPVADADRPHHGRVARYALGDDYHEIIKGRLYDLADWLRERAGGETRCGVDTAPVMERELHARAGVGWVGKNTCVIHPQAGSWILLGEVLTTLELPADAPMTDHCGTCTRCLDACPTGALTAPYELDATRCISYLTIEHRGEIAPDLRPLIGDWLYGCDVCQDVCPHNARVPVATDPALKPRFPTGTLDVRQVGAWTEEEYRPALRRSAMKRVKLPQLRRNAQVVRENTERARSQ
ncbi:MAG TPA: tRNA epoxyqueuosine(34) reductase QueG [Tepidisphaeraceae bacterium]|nr:tRNA epoxyqueuosine(34) reductase QueG [Tepidisphaeraceae bacterium]